MDMQKTTQ